MEFFLLSSFDSGPHALLVCVQVEVCCFDKTGTLTSDHLLLEDVVVPEPGMRALAHRVMATCHSLVQVVCPGFFGEGFRPMMVDHGLLPARCQGFYMLCFLG